MMNIRWSRTVSMWLVTQFFLVVLLSVSIRSEDVVPTDATYEGGHIFTLGKIPVYSSGTWNSLNPGWFRIFGDSLDGSWGTPTLGAQVLASFGIHGGQNMQIQIMSDIACWATNVGEVASDGRDGWVRVTYHWKPKQLNVPPSTLMGVPIRMTLKGSVWAYGGTGYGYQATWGRGEVSVGFRQPDGVWKTKQLIVTAESGFILTNPPLDTGYYTIATDNQTATFTGEVAPLGEEGLTVLYAKLIVAAKKSATFGPGVYVSSGQVIVDPVIEVDPTATVDDQGVTRPVTDFYTLEFSRGFTSGTNPLAPYALWASDNGMDPAGAGAFDRDADGDSIPNGMEFITGTNPAAQEDSPPLSVTQDGANAYVTFYRTRDSSVVNLWLHASPDLVNWANETSIPSSPVQSPALTVADLGVTKPYKVTVTVPLNGASSMFFRLKGTVP